MCNTNDSFLTEDGTLDDDTRTMMLFQTARKLTCYEDRNIQMELIHDLVLTELTDEQLDRIYGNVYAVEP